LLRPHRLHVLAELTHIWRVKVGVSVASLTPTRAALLERGLASAPCGASPAGALEGGGSTRLPLVGVDFHVT